MINLDDQGCNRLVRAIVTRAVQDWRIARRRLRKYPNNEVQKEIMADCERFFMSAYFTNLTGMDGKEFMARLNEQMAIEERNKIPMKVRKNQRD